MTTRSLACTYSAGSPPTGLPTKAEILGRAGGENFKVASRLLPRATRGHLLAFYGYARLIDHIGDEYAGDRLSCLAWVEGCLEDALAEAGDGPDPGPPTIGSDATEVIREAAHSVAELKLAPAPLFDLIEANRLDQSVTTYATFDDLMGYCRLSADPVGRLVLGAFGYTDTDRIAWSDSICTGLQLAEHWQDVAEDLAVGRVYIPLEDLDRFGLPARDLQSRGMDAALDRPGWRALLAFEVARTRRILDEGRPLIASLTGSARWAVVGFWAGGQAALDGIADRDFDVQTPPGRINRLTLLRRLARATRSTR